MKNIIILFILLVFCFSCHYQYLPKAGYIIKNKYTYKHKNYLLFKPILNKKYTIITYIEDSCRYDLFKIGDTVKLITHEGRFIIIKNDTLIHSD